MGSGIIAALKNIAPIIFYAGGVILFFKAVTGKVQWALLCVVFLLPLRNVVDKLQDYPLGNQFLDILILGIIVGWFVSSLSQKTKFMEKTFLNKIAVFLIIYTFFSLLRGAEYLSAYSFFDISDPRAQSWKNFCLLPVLYFITVNNVRDKKEVWRVFTVMCCAMVLMGYYTSAQVSWFSSLLSRGKISGTFQFLGPNEVAAFYNQYTVILLSVYFFMKKGIKKTLLLLLILLNTYCMMFMYSRAAYLAAAVGLFLLFAFKKRWLLIPLLLVALFWQTALPEKARERFESTTNEYGQLEESAERRVQIWEKGMELFRENFLVGIGYGVFSQLGYNLGDTHNIYVKILVEQGVVGMLIFLILIFSFIAEGFRLYAKGDDDLSKGLGLGLAVCMFVLLVNNIFGDRWSYLELSGYLWIFAGLVARLNIISQEGNSSPQPRLKTKKPYGKKY